MTPLAGPRDEVPDGVLETQLAYYRARVDEYDEWFHRHGRYDRGAEQTTAWRAEVEVVRSWLADLDLDGRDVLELAPGTGLWTVELLDAGASVTAVDAAPEMLEALRRRCEGPRLTTVLADLFSWAPARAYDAVVACFFMSHVPDARFDAFLEMLADAVAVGGRVFLLDGVREHASTARDHVLGDASSQTMERRLDDGRTFEIVKVFRGDEELAAACRRAGLDARVRRTTTYFQVVDGRRT